MEVRTLHVQSPSWSDYVFKCEKYNTRLAAWCCARKSTLTVGVKFVFLPVQNHRFQKRCYYFKFKSVSTIFFPSEFQRRQ